MCPAQHAQRQTDVHARLEEVRCKLFQDREEGSGFAGRHEIWLDAGRHFEAVIHGSRLFPRKKGARGTAVAFSQICSTGVHWPGKDRENLNQRGCEFLGESGMIAEMVNLEMACSIGLSRRAPRKIDEPGRLAMDQS